MYEGKAENIVYRLDSGGAFHLQRSPLYVIHIPDIVVMCCEIQALLPGFQLMKVSFHRTIYTWPLGGLYVRHVCVRVHVCVRACVFVRALCVCVFA